MVDLFSGGAFKKFSVFALGITPYITASIVLQLMGAVVPTLENLQKKEGEAGREKINQWTRYLTVGLAFVQGFGIASLAQSLGPDVVTIPGIGFKFLCGLHPVRRHHLRHVARRADHRARHRQRHLAS